MNYTNNEPIRCRSFYTAAAAAAAAADFVSTFSNNFIFLH